MPDDEYEYLQAKIEALEFLIRQLLVWHMQRTDEPRETALSLQAQFAMRIGEQSSQETDSETKARIQRTAEKIHFLMEALIGALEREDNHLK